MSFDAAALMPAYVRRPDQVYAVCVTSAAVLEELQKVGAPVSWAPNFWVVETAHTPAPSDFGDYLATDGKGDWWPVRANLFHERYDRVGNVVGYCRKCSAQLSSGYCVNDECAYHEFPQGVEFDDVGFLVRAEDAKLRRKVK